MRGGSLERALAVAVIGVVAGSSSAAAAAGSSTGAPTKAAKAHAATLAHAALLRSSDLSGWNSTAPPKKVPGLTCPAFNPDLTAFTPLAAAASRTFRQSSQFASQVVYMFASATQERGFWRRVVGRRLLTCVADGLVAGSSNGITFTVDRKHMESVPKIGERDRAYRVVGTATSPGQTETVYLDVLVVGRGSGVAAISYTNLFSPVARATELRLARTVARRLPAQ
jgi:hypothetical protein